MEFHQTYNIFRLKKIWESIVNNNTRIKPTQHYDYYLYLFIVFYLKHLGQRWQIIFFFFVEGSNKCIVPLIVNRKRKKIFGFSHYKRLDYEDIITSTTDEIFNLRCLSKVLHNYSGYSIHIDNVNESSILYSLLKSNMVFDINCVSIDIGGGYDKWFSRISKHQQQNIRSAYNRLSRESFGIKLMIYDANHPIPHCLWKRCCLLYERRSGDTGNKWQLWKNRQLNAYTHILHRVKGYRIYVLFYNSIPIAYMAGILSERHHCFYVPRLSHDIDYNRYSPGILLICATIRDLSSTCTQSIDLMLGDEPYKLAMGGTVTKNYMLHSNIDDLL